MRNWQSNLSIIPPCPGIVSPKSWKEPANWGSGFPFWTDGCKYACSGWHTLILKARLKPLAKNPPNGPMIEANRDMEMVCSMNGYIRTVCRCDIPTWNKQMRLKTKLQHRRDLSSQRGMIFYFLASWDVERLCTIVQFEPIWTFLGGGGVGQSRNPKFCCFAKNRPRKWILGSTSGEGL